MGNYFSRQRHSKQELLQFGLYSHWKDFMPALSSFLGYLALNCVLKEAKRLQETNRNIEIGIDHLFLIFVMKSIVVQRLRSVCSCRFYCFVKAVLQKILKVIFFFFKFYMYSPISSSCTKSHFMHSHIYLSNCYLPISVYISLYIKLFCVLHALYNWIL